MARKRSDNEAADHVGDVDATIRRLQKRVTAVEEKVDRWFAHIAANVGVGPPADLEPSETNTTVATNSLEAGTAGGGEPS